MRFETLFNVTLLLVGSFVAMLLITERALGGWLIGGGTSVAVFSLRPVNFEKTPNYYGVGLITFAGYSIDQLVDIVGMVSYTPGHTGHAIIGKEQAQFIFYGGQVGIRLDKQAYIGLFAGLSQYRLVTATEEALPGFWQGSGAGLRIGSLHGMDKQRTLEVSMSYQFADLIKASPPSQIPAERSLDQISFSVIFSFNHFMARSRGRSIFSGFF